MFTEGGAPYCLGGEESNNSLIFETYTLPYIHYLLTVDLPVTYRYVFFVCPYYVPCSTHLTSSHVNNAMKGTFITKRPSKLVF